jgi:hypothetical protein
MIKSLYTNYTQKSRMFLYPFLGIKRGISITPLESYISWTGMSEPEDKNLICVYTLRDDEEFKLFERTKLLGNSKFSLFYELPDNKGAYVFTFGEESVLWDCFLRGKYTEIAKDKKALILKFFEGNTQNHSLIDSYLNPDKYYQFYADELGVPVNVLKEVGQLCEPPNLEKEKLTSDIKQIEFLDYI